MGRRLLVPAAIVLLLGGCVAGVLGGMSPQAIEAFVARHWRFPLAPQGAPPPSFSALEASLTPEACGSCHPSQLADWRTSVHAASMGPGIHGQLVEMLDSDRASALACYTCHAPLGEQRPLASSADAGANPVFDRSLQSRGV